MTWNENIGNGGNKKMTRNEKGKIKTKVTDNQQELQELKRELKRRIKRNGNM